MNIVGGTAQIALQHPVAQRNRETVRLQQGGREEDLVVLRRGLISDLKENYTTII